jgi:hypothetical protein
MELCPRVEAFGITERPTASMTISNLLGHEMHEIGPRSRWLARERTPGSCLFPAEGIHLTSGRVERLPLLAH